MATLSETCLSVLLIFLVVSQPTLGSAGPSDFASVRGTHNNGAFPPQPNSQGPPVAPPPPGGDSRECHFNHTTFQCASLSDTCCPVDVAESEVCCGESNFCITLPDGKYACINQNITSDVCLLEHDHEEHGHDHEEHGHDHEEHGHDNKQEGKGCAGESKCCRTKASLSGYGTCCEEGSICVEGEDDFDECESCSDVLNRTLLCISVGLCLLVGAGNPVVWIYKFALFPYIFVWRRLRRLFCPSDNSSDDSGDAEEEHHGHGEANSLREFICTHHILLSFATGKMHVHTNASQIVLVLATCCAACFFEKFGEEEIEECGYPELLNAFQAASLTSAYEHYFGGFLVYTLAVRDKNPAKFRRLSVWMILGLIVTFGCGVYGLVGDEEGGVDHILDSLKAVAFGFCIIDPLFLTISYFVKKLRSRASVQDDSEFHLLPGGEGE